MADWEDTFEGASLDAKWTLWPLSASCSATISNGKLDLFADGPTDGADTMMVVYQQQASISFPLDVIVNVSCPVLSLPPSSDFTFLILYGGGVAASMTNAAGLLWTSSGFVQPRMSGSTPYDLHGGDGKLCLDSTIDLKISIDADGLVSLSYKGENESDFTSLTPADGTPSF
ncbi:MAG: hypothetical protein JEZ02_03620, partial [Desulfatibacillum sp.]|nr:hypothetical protein [Desulfatibacillum sp.]